MVICIKRGKKKDINDIALVLAKSGFADVEYKHLDYNDAYNGVMIGSIKGTDKVEVILGEQRKAIFKEIRHDVFDRFHDAVDLVDTINLIEDMEADHDTRTT